MRSAREITFRLHQIAANAIFLALQPKFRGDPQPAPLPFLFPPLPDSVALADEILAHRFPLFDGIVETGPDIDWRRDYLSGRTSGLGYYRLIPYLDFSLVGDHKVIWELNRHQHLVVLAEAFQVTSRREYVAEIERQLVSWIEQNPFLRGINWASALEVAFRALSWMQVDQLAGDALDAGVRRQLWNGLYRHGLHLEHNLSIYFAPNTHLLGEGVALHALGLRYAGFRQTGHWQRLGARIVQAQLKSQVRDDGSHFEQSTYYHVYALDLFLYHCLLVRQREIYGPAIRRMSEYLEALLGPARKLPFFGDDDGGRVFHPYGARDEFGRATLAASTAIFPRAAASGSRLFPQAGMAAIAIGDLHILFDAGPFGPGGAGHSHSDTLSFTLRKGDREILIDPGTYTYVGNAKWRDWFRGSSAHNTIRIDELDQGDPTRPFRWDRKPEARVREWSASPAGAYLDAECAYRGFVHRRRIFVPNAGLVLVIDDVGGPEGQHRIERFWHFADDAASLLLVTAPGESAETVRGGDLGWRSPVYNSRIETPTVRISTLASLPYRCATAFLLDSPANATLSLSGNEVTVSAAEELAVTFPDAGCPSVRS